MPKANIHLKLLALLLLLLAGTTENLQAAGIIPDRAHAQKIVAAMSLRQRIGQLFIVDLARLAAMQEITQLTPELKSKINADNFGGIILFAQNLRNRQQLTDLIHDIQNCSSTPPFICIDEEGGRVSRLEHCKALGLTQLPSAAEIGSKSSKSYAYQVGKTLAEQVKSFGFNVDFAPVLDINTNPDNPVIGARAFADNPQLVTEMGLEVIRGLQENGVMACAKHFPGHGDTSTDTHLELAYINHDITRLNNEEFVPFKAAIDSGVMSIMLAHIVAPKITGNNLPATMSQKFATAILRNELNFKGLIITDALMMKAITNNYTSGEACIKALNAGVDILLMPDNIAQAVDAVYKEAQQNEHFRNLIEKAVTRIILAKMRLNILP